MLVSLFCALAVVCPNRKVEENWCTGPACLAWGNFAALAKSKQGDFISYASFSLLKVQALSERF